MFTGIVRELGTVAAVKRGREGDRLSIHAPKTAPRLAVGESLAVNGVCLSVVGIRDGALEFDVIPETRRRTNLGRLSSGDRVNLEHSLTLSDRLSGHLVLGHVDGMGRVLRVDNAKGETHVTIRIDRAVRRYLVPKGSIAVDGVSLTVGPTLSPTAFSVFLIPETRTQTTLGLRRVGDLVNIEADYFAKLILQRWQQRPDALAPLLRGVTKRNRHAEID